MILDQIKEIVMLAEQEVEIYGKISNSVSIYGNLYADESININPDF